jgi:hypothetical protein
MYNHLEKIWLEKSKTSFNLLNLHTSKWMDLPANYDKEGIRFE